MASIRQKSKQQATPKGQKGMQTFEAHMSELLIYNVNKTSCVYKNTLI